MESRCRHSLALDELLTYGFPPKRHSLSEFLRWRGKSGTLDLVAKAAEVWIIIADPAEKTTTSWIDEMTTWRDFPTHTEQ